MPGFVIQPSYSEFDHEECRYEIDGEFLSNGFPNHLKNDVGCVAMGGDGKSRASGCEFYFTLAYHERLDGNYPVFGKVIEGWMRLRGWSMWSWSMCPAHTLVSRSTAP